MINSCFSEINLDYLLIYVLKIYCTSLCPRLRMRVFLYDGKEEPIFPSSRIKVLLFHILLNSVKWFSCGSITNVLYVTFELMIISMDKMVLIP